MRLVGADEMRRIDRRAATDFGIPGRVLMEHAGRSCCDVAEEYLDLADATAVVLCGPGNNGGDGAVIARLLANRGARVSAVLLGRADALRGDARANWQALAAAPVARLVATDRRALRRSLAGRRGADLIVDAVFGTGFAGEPRDPARSAIDWVNGESGLVLAVDLPSGAAADDGSVATHTVHADVTVAICYPKRSHLLFPARDYCGDLWVADIGIPYAALATEGRVGLVDDDDAADALPPRPADGHKGTFGDVLVIAGARGYDGAATLASLGALRMGAGLVRVAFPAPLTGPIAAKLTEVIKVPLPATDDETLALDAEPALVRLLAGASAVALGPGLGRNAETGELVRRLVARSTTPCVLDADGINAFADDPDRLRRHAGPLVLTPHPGELARLVGSSAAAVNRDRIDLAAACAARWDCVVVLKGTPTVTARPDGQTRVNPTADSGLATGGAGDVLTGMIAALIGQGCAPFAAGWLGAFLHGRSGELASAARTPTAVAASDLVDFLPGALRSLASEETECPAPS